MERDRICIQVFAHLAHHGGEIGACAVHFVDEGDTGHTVAVSLIPDCLALGLNASDSAE